MKRKKTLIFALILSIVVVLLMGSVSPVQAQRPNRYTYDTGLILPAVQKIMRVTVTSVASEQDDPLFFDIGSFLYSPTNCSPNNVCIKTVVSQTSNRIRLMPGEAASFDIPSTGNGVRALIESNRRMIVNAHIIDPSTGEVEAIIAILIG